MYEFLMHLWSQGNSLAFKSNRLQMIGVLHVVVCTPILDMVRTKQVLGFEIVEKILSIDFVMLSIVPTSFLVAFKAKNLYYGIPVQI